MPEAATTAMDEANTPNVEQLTTRAEASQAEDVHITLMSHIGH